MSIDPSARIHPSALVEEGAIIGANVEIGPFSVVGPEVELKSSVRLMSHVVVTGQTQVGEGTVIFPFASIGHQPQDLKFSGEKTQLIIGARNKIREHVTMNPGTEGGGGVTKVGDDGLFMMGVHVGHDCMVGNHVILANNASLGGHCVIEDRVVIGALAGVHQFCRVGRGAMIGGLAAVVADVIPYGAVTGPRATLNGLNLTGLKRAGADRDLVNGLRAFFKDAFLSGVNISEQLPGLSAQGDENALIEEVIKFISDGGKRSLTVVGQR